VSPDEAVPDAVDAADTAESRELLALRERLRVTELRLKGLQEIGQIGHLLSSGADLTHVLGEIADRTTTLMDCERATLYVMSDDGKRLVARIAGQERPLAIELELGRGIAGWVAEHCRVVNLKDAYKDPRFDARTDQLTGFRTRSVLSQPVLDRHGRPLGVVQALNKRDGYFSTADEALLETIAIQAAVVMRSARVVVDLAEKHHALLEAQVKLAERNSEIDLMFSIERAVAVARGLDEGLDGALQATLTEYPCDAAAVLLLDEHDAESAPETRRWRVQRTAGDEGSLFSGRAGVAGEPLLSEPLVGGRELVLFDHPVLRAVPPLLASLPRIETLALIPLRWRGRDKQDDSAEERTLGALMLVNSRRFPKGFDDLDRHKLGVIASRLALSVTLAKALDEERKAERMAAIGGALSGIVHDLRTPLTLLDGYARLLARGSRRIRGRHCGTSTSARSRSRTA
jgi:GAF domain-containing protein